MLSDDRQAQLDALRDALEEEYMRRTEQLTVLTVRAGDPTRADAGTSAALAASRKALADIARALRYMAEDRYGVCDECGRDIPVEHLEDDPQARFCVSCGRPERCDIEPPTPRAPLVESPRWDGSVGGVGLARAAG